MGVHKKEAYPEIKKLLEIPEDEPIFILRAKDKIAPEAIEWYGDSAEIDGAGQEFASEITACAEAFFDWQKNNPSKVRLPD